MIGGPPDGGSVSENVATTWTVYTDGGVTDKWGTTWTVSDINSSTFGFGIQFENVGDPSDIEVDYMKLAVTYTEGATGRTHRVIGYGRGTTRTETLPFSKGY